MISSKIPAALSSGIFLFVSPKSPLQKQNRERNCPVINVITGIRIICALFLIFCPTFSARFYVLYIVGGISDVLDGFAARRLGKETAFGARFDTIADAVFTLTVLIKMIRAIGLPIPLILWIVCIAVIKCINVISGFVLYKRFVSEHTVMNRLCGVLLFVIPLCIGSLPWRLTMALFILTCIAASAAALQEGYDIRSGKEIR